MSGHMRRSENEDGMRHPDKSILLAYTRQQSLGEVEPSIRQHIELCKECSRCCDEYKQLNIELKDTLAYWQRTAVYPAVVDRVFEAIENPVAARRERRAERRQRNAADGTKQRSLNWTRLLSTGVAALLVIAFASFFLHGSSFEPNNNKQGHSNSLVIPGHITTATPTHSSTVQVTGTAEVIGGTTVTPGTQEFTLSVCDLSAHSFTLCASSLKPGDGFQVMVNVRGKGSLPQHEAVVDRDGNLTATWNVNICGVNHVNVHLHNRKTSLDISQLVAVPNKGCFSSMH